MPFSAMIEELERRRERAMAMGGSEKLEKRRSQGILNARERVDHLVDPDSFIESGLYATSARPEMREKTPGDGKVCGFALVNGREVGVVSNDFTVLGASSAVINQKKVKHVKDVANKRGFPVIFLGETSGARMPDRMGAPGRAIVGQDGAEYQRLRTAPLGICTTWQLFRAFGMVCMPFRFCGHAQGRNACRGESSCRRESHRTLDYC